MDDELEDTGDLEAVLTFTFSDGASFDYSYEYTFAYGAPDATWVEINEMPVDEVSSSP